MRNPFTICRREGDYRFELGRLEIRWLALPWDFVFRIDECPGRWQILYRKWHFVWRRKYTVWGEERMRLRDKLQA